MKAGRELDALVAEKVMGLVLTCPVDPRFDHSVGTNKDGSSAKRNFCRWPDGREHWIPFFSTDIADAWQVVEKLAGDGDEHPACIQKGLPAFGDHATPFEVYKNYAGYPGWTCYFADYEVCAHADTAPLAICKAALKACGVEVESPK